MKAKPIAISEAMEAVLRGLGGGRGPQACSVSAVWAKAAGEDGLKHAKPVDIKDGVLIVHVDSSGWLHKLTMEKIQLLSKIKEGLGDDIVKDLKLRIGPVGPVL
jgi:predicted nucleic acid-binding Zn ribbon protein